MKKNLFADFLLAVLLSITQRLTMCDGQPMLTQNIKDKFMHQAELFNKENQKEVKRGNRFIDRTGQRFGRLTVVSFDSDSNGKRLRWICRCDCGKTKSIMGESLVAGSTRSCTCLSRETTVKVLTRHGHSKAGNVSKTWTKWSSMKARILNPNTKYYSNYGGRGITICQRWLDSFENFLADMGDCPPGLTLERNNSDGNYEPGNCCWANFEQQANNQRRIKTFTHNGKTQSLARWSRELGIKFALLYERVSNLGWTFERAVTEQPRQLSSVTHGGKTQTISNWSRELGINRNTLDYRINVAKWDIDKAFNAKPQEATA